MTKRSRQRPAGRGVCGVPDAIIKPVGSRVPQGLPAGVWNRSLRRPNVGLDLHALSQRVERGESFYTQMDGTGQIQRQGKLTNSREALAEFFGDVAEPARVVIEASRLVR